MCRQALCLVLPLVLAAFLSCAVRAAKPQSRGVRAHYEYGMGCGKSAPHKCPWRAGQKSLIVDTDPGLGLYLTDIDECAAYPPPLQSLPLSHAPLAAP